jgi:ABC-2 type transport system permease protein
MEPSLSELDRRATRPPAAAFWRLLRVEARLAWRMPALLIGGLALPLVLLVIFAAIPAFRRPSANLGGLTPLDVYLPILIVFAIAIQGLNGLSPRLAGYREQGVLRRLSTTPVSPSWLLGAQLVINLAIAAAAVVLLLVVSVAAWSVVLPSEVPGFVLTLVLAATATFALGLWIAAVARTAHQANIIGGLLFYPMMFFGGLWWPQQLMPAGLRMVSECTPLGAAVQAMQDTMQGSFPAARALLVLLAYSVVFALAAIRYFRWE